MQIFVAAQEHLVCVWHRYSLIVTAPVKSEDICYFSGLLSGSIGFHWFGWSGYIVLSFEINRLGLSCWGSFSTSLQVRLETRRQNSSPGPVSIDICCSISLSLLKARDSALHAFS